MTLAPITGTLPLPVKDRPKCHNCKKPLRPKIRSEYGAGLGQGATTRYFTGEYGLYRGRFCTNSCAIEWAVARTAAQSK